MRAWWVVLAGCGRIGFQPTGGDARSPVDATDPSLVAYYPMDVLDGTTTPDATGHGHVATCPAQMCPGVVAAHVGSGLQFGGLDDHLVIANASDLDTTTAYTIALWVRFDSLTSSSSCPVNKPFGAGQNDTWQLCLASDASLFFASSGSSVLPSDMLSSPTNVIHDGDWHHVALRWDSGAKSLWLDGVDQNDDQAESVFDSNDLVFGYDLDGSTVKAAFAGVLDEVRIYNRALLPAEIVQLAQ